MNSSTFTTIGLVIILSILQGTNGLKCWQQICRECPSTSTDGPGTEVTCEFRNLVGTSWLDKTRQSDDTYNTNIKDPQFSCIKLVASNPKIVGDSTDIIRGCAMREEASNICEALKTISQMNQKGSADCSVCERDNCNGANGHTTSIAMSIFAITSVLKYYYF